MVSMAHSHLIKKKVTHFLKNKTIMKQFCLKSESQHSQKFLS